ncbi:hypothetical protein [Paenibacillus sp. Z6-24]
MMGILVNHSSTEHIRLQVSRNDHIWSDPVPDGGFPARPSKFDISLSSMKKRQVIQ